MNCSNNDDMDETYSILGFIFIIILAIVAII